MRTSPLPLIGRSAELDRIRRALGEGERLVTIKGPGGMGKTRLLVECAPDGWCDFTDRTDAGQALAEALGCEPEAIPAVLARRTIGFDNFESVIATGRALVRDLLERTEARFLVASREALDLPGERVIELAPLDVDTDALVLFLQHAGRRDPPLVRTKENEAAIAALVRAVDGIPLALELAARRSAVLGVETVLGQLREGISILSRPGGDRHASLEKVIDGSFAGLSGDERAAFLSSAVFRGGFDLEAARAVLEGDVPTLLQSLADKSLLRLDAPGGRFRMHEVIREFALDRLEGHRAAVAHARHFIGWIEAIRPPAGVIPDRAHRERVLADAANVRAAAEHALASGDVQGCARALAAIAPTLRMYGEPVWWGELRGKLKKADIDPEIVARLDLAEALMLSLRGRRDEAEARAAELAASAADPEVKLAAMILGVQHALDRGDADAAARLIAAPARAVHPALEAERLLIRAQTLDPRSPETRAALERAQEAADALGDATLLAANARVRASFELACGNVVAARASLEKERAIAERAELEPVLAQSSLRLGCAAHVAGDLEEAVRWLEDGEQRIETLALRGRIPRAKLLLGWVWLERGDLDRARAFFEASEKAAQALHAPAAESDAVRALEIASMLTISKVPDARPADPRLWASPAADLERVIGAVFRRMLSQPLVRIATDPEVRTFDAGNGPVDLSDRPSLRNILRALLEARGAPVESAILISAGWPGERIREDAARNRLRVAIATLRKLGLEGAIETGGTTYRLRALRMNAATSSSTPSS